MNMISELNGYALYDGFVSGYENLAVHKQRINDINVFPVPDGDTGTNMASTFYSTLQVPEISRSVSRTMGHIADRALSGARGNSGIIVAQFLNAFAAELDGRETVTTGEFGVALRKAAHSAYKSVDNPREGTVLTLLRVWSEEMERLGHLVADFGELFTRSAETARIALKETTNQLDTLKRAKVVDAGASGIVAFIEGVCRMIVTGVRPQRNRVRALVEPSAEGDTHEPHTLDENLPFRFCTEALLGGRADTDELKALLAGRGDSLVVSAGRDKTKLHIHTNDPAEVFLKLKRFGDLLEQKVDDMLLQREAVHRPVSSVAIVTDSIADIPRALLDRLQIHVIPQKILWGGDEYLDRVTITGATFYPYLDERKEYPGSSVPDPRRVEQVFAWLSTHYKAIVAIPVAKALSGTWQVFDNAARPLRDSGYPIAVVDSRLNSAAQGLAVISAAEDAAAGIGPSDILENLERTIRGSRIYVSVATFKYMVRGGRISAVKGLVAALANLKPIISLNPQGKGVAFGASFSLAGSRKKLLRQAAKNRDSIHRYAVVHAGSPARAKAVADDLEALTGFPCEFIDEISPAVGIHAGIGAVAIAWI